MLTYSWKDCPWAVRHKVAGDTHSAWRMRAFLIGDFAPGKAGRNDYVIERDNTPGDRTKRPRCETCDKVPQADDLIVVERATGDRHFLDPYRDGLRPWPPGTNDGRCWWCQTEIGPKDKDDLCGSCARLAKEPSADAIGAESTGPLIPPTSVEYPPVVP